MKKSNIIIYTAILLIGLYISIVYFISVWFNHPEVLPFPVEEIEAGSLMGFIDSIFAFGLITGFGPLAIGAFGLSQAWQCAKQRARQEELLRAQRRAERRARRAEKSRY